MKKDTRTPEEIIADLRARVNALHPQPIHIANDIANAAAIDGLKAFFEPEGGDDE